MRQVLGAGALGTPKGMGWRGRLEGGSGWGTHVNPWLIHVNVWQKPLQYCKVISLQLIKINEKKNKRICLQCRRPGFSPWAGKIPWRREELPTPVFWPGEFHVLYSPWGSQRVGHSCVTFTSLHNKGNNSAHCLMQLKESAP